MTAPVYKAGYTGTFSFATVDLHIMDGAFSFSNKLIESTNTGDNGDSSFIPGINYRSFKCKAGYDISNPALVTVLPGTAGVASLLTPGTNKSFSANALVESFEYSHTVDTEAIYNLSLKVSGAMTTIAT